MAKKDITIGVRVDAETESILREIAEQQDRTVSWLAREYILEALEKRGHIKKRNPKAKK